MQSSFGVRKYKIGALNCTTRLQMEGKYNLLRNWDYPDKENA